MCLSQKMLPELSLAIKALLHDSLELLAIHRHSPLEHVFSQVAKDDGRIVGQHVMAIRARLSH